MMEPFARSQKFKKLLRMAYEMKRDVFIAKLEDFAFDKEDNLFIESLKKDGKLQVFDLYKHKDDKFEGYITRKLMNKLDFNDKVSLIFRYFHF